MSQIVCLIVSFGICLSLWKSRVNYLLLGRLPMSDAHAQLDLTVIIPARNEAHQIGNTISSFSNVRVVVVDDASSDDTANVSEAAGAEVITAPPVREGKLGKPNACAAGAAIAKTKWLLFVDADTVFEKCFATSAVAYAEEHNYDMLSAFLEQRCCSIFEKMLLPYSFALYFTGVSARAVNGRGNQSALANGQCLLFRRSAYEEIGGHSKVITSVIEDVAIAQRAKQNSLSVRVIRAEHLGSVRMYTGFASIWRGFQKNSFRFLQANPIGGVQVILASMLLTSWLPALILGLHEYQRPFSIQMLFAPTPVLLLLISPLLTLLPWYAESHAARSWRVILAPFAIYLFQLIALNGMFVTIFGRATDWKGRSV